MTSISANHDTSPRVLGALALELRGDAPVERATLPQSEVGELAELIARDLAAFCAEATSLELITVGAHYDPVEMLRPGWPLHHELDQLAARAPHPASLGDVAGVAPSRVVAFGTHEGRLPGALMPSSDYAGGPFRLVPFVLNAVQAISAEAAAAVADEFESGLLERGMAGAATALAAQAAFGVQVEHARYLTVHDLTAMIAMQYEHAGLAPLWPLLETALLQPDGEEWLDAPPEPLLRYVKGEVRIAMFSPQAWHARYAAQVACDTDECREQLHRRHQHFEARQRQYAAVLAAHGVTVNFVHCERVDGWRDAL